MPEPIVHEGRCDETPISPGIDPFGRIPTPAGKRFPGLDIFLTVQPEENHDADGAREPGKYGKASWRQGRLSTGGNGVFRSGDLRSRDGRSWFSRPRGELR